MGGTSGTVCDDSDSPMTSRRDFSDGDGDVVVTTVRQGDIDQHRRPRAQIVLRLHGRQDQVLADLVGEAIAAQEEAAAVIEP